ncbi:hypothetical protein [Crenothrix polyspora]|uniref:Uncharacterized protein n=1 Tax=Crenothrix polyspora TaxID=360316 RepID=A0A1R4GYC5_9GAMM|nr:hypothetical protein [Crenothrix polyspora]SJM88983.1 hypothetical protein CRENPOLYSF1_10015 [Crenothrix polyspora]
MSFNSSDIQKFASLDNLRRYHNERFVRLACYSILGRKIDDGELNYQTKKIIDGLSAAEFLAVLTSSSEDQTRWKYNNQSGSNLLDIPLHSTKNKINVEPDFYFNAHRNIKTPLEELGREYIRGNR